MKALLRFPVYHYQFPGNYGPGMNLPLDAFEGLVEKSVEKEPGQIGVVSVHCWNLGEPNGPYPFKEGIRVHGKVSDWVPRARDIITNRIRPVLETAQQAGVPIFHLASPAYADRYPQYKVVKEDPELAPPRRLPTIPGCVRPRTVQQEHSEQFGPHWPGPIGVTHRELFDIAEPVKPKPEDYVVTDGWQLNGLCRRLNIDMLVYVGFAGDLCFREIPGAIREMASRFRYSCVALRDCTTAFEFEDTWPDLMNRANIRYIEAYLGYSASSEDFICACKKVSTESS